MAAGKGKGKGKSKGKGKGANAGKGYEEVYVAKSPRKVSPLPPRQTGPRTMAVCAVHDKKRTWSVLEEDGIGGMRCQPEFVCKIGKPRDDPEEGELERSSPYKSNKGKGKGKIKGPDVAWEDYATNLLCGYSIKGKGKAEVVEQYVPGKGTIGGSSRYKGKGRYVDHWR